MTREDQRKKALENIRAVYEDGEAEINGRKYRFLKMQHVSRRKVFAYYTSIQRQLQLEDFSFLDSTGFAGVEEVMWNSITFDGALISKLRDHWEEVPEDYVSLVATAMGVMSYPFLRASGIASASVEETQAKTTSSKPM